MFVEKVQQELGIRGRHRGIAEDDATHVLREPPQSYDDIFEGEKGVLSIDNAHFWNQRTISSEG